MSKTNKISLRLDAVTHDALKLALEHLNMTESSYVRALIIKHLERSGYLNRAQFLTDLERELEQVS